jgi:iron complex transport system substrate-binding protein
MSCSRLTLLLLVLTCHSWAEDPTRRVVSLAPSITQTVRHVGAEDRLVGVTSFCDASDEVVRVQGGILAEPEAVLGLAPNLVLCTTMTPAGTRKQMSDLGLRVEVIETPTLESIREATQRIAELLGVNAPSEQIQHLPANGPSAALLFGAETGYSAGCGSHAHAIMQAAGLRNIAAEASGPWPQLGEEFLLRKDPEVLVIADYDDSKREEILAKLRAHPTRRHLRAVQSGKVIVFPAGAFSVPGPEALAAAPKLRAAIDAP